MHKAEQHESRASLVITQAQADACCAAASGRESGPSPSPAASAISVAALGTAAVMPAAAPPLVITDSWRVLEPIPLASPPRHLLLATFLI
jgi:hypothetical protein